MDFRFFEPQEPSQKEIKPSRGRTVAVYSRKWIEDLASEKNELVHYTLTLLYTWLLRGEPEDLRPYGLWGIT